MPVLLVLLHGDCLLGLTGLDELVLCLLEALLILQEQRLLQVHVLQLVLRVRIGQLERLFEASLVSLEINRCFRET